MREGAALIILRVAPDRPGLVEAADVRVVLDDLVELRSRGGAGALGRDDVQGRRD